MAAKKNLCLLIEAGHVRHVAEALREVADAYDRGQDENRRCRGDQPLDNQVDLGIKLYEEMRTSSGVEVRATAFF